MQVVYAFFGMPCWGSYHILHRLMWHHGIIFLRRGEPAGLTQSHFFIFFIFETTNFSSSVPPKVKTHIMNCPPFTWLVFTQVPCIAAAGTSERVRHHQVGTTPSRADHARICIGLHYLCAIIRVCGQIGHLLTVLGSYVM